MKKLNYVQKNMILSLIFLKLMPASPCQFGKPRAGFIKTTPEAGFSGIAVTIWAGDMKTTQGRLNVGKLLGGIGPRCAIIANKEILIVGASRDKLFYTGLMTAAKFKFNILIFKIWNVSR